MSVMMLRDKRDEHKDMAKIDVIDILRWRGGAP